MGRGSKLPAWLLAAGAAPVHEETADSGFVYYTRFFRGTLPRVPRTAHDADRVDLDPHAARRSGHLVGDDLRVDGRPARRSSCATAIAGAPSWRSLPLHAHWADGEPIGRRRRDERHRRPLPPHRPRRPAGRDRRRPRRRTPRRARTPRSAGASRFGLMHAAALPGDRARAPRRPAGVQRGLGREHRGAAHALVPGHGRVRSCASRTGRGDPGGAPGAGARHSRREGHRGARRGGCATTPTSSAASWTSCPAWRCRRRSWRGPGSPSASPSSPRRTTRRRRRARTARSCSRLLA